MATTPHSARPEANRICDLLVQNSWGTTWGDQGFAYAGEACLTGAFCNESFGVTP